MDKDMARRYGVSERRVQQQRKEYSDDIKLMIVRVAEKYRCGAVRVSKILREKYGLKLDHNKVQEVLRVNGMANEERDKRKRKNPWIRYEREHSLSAVHMDWYYDEVSGKWVCAVMDDSPTADASIKLLDEAYSKYLHIAPISEVITDHGSQFYANKRNKKGYAKHSFENYCREKGIKHILCKYKHPQSNGKLEMWFHTYQQHRHAFHSLHEFVD